MTDLFRRVLRDGIKRFRHGRRGTRPARATPVDLAPLSALPTGCGGRVAALTGGHGLIARLAALGLTPGVPFEVAQNSGHGPIIVLVRETRLALGRGEAEHILSAPTEACSDLASA